VKPYYEDDLITLYHGDCIEAPAWLDADVLITDPPYGMAYTGFGGRKGEPRKITGALNVAGDDSPAMRDAALDLWGTERAALVFGKWTIARPTGTRQRIIWDKTPCGFMGDLSIPWGGAEEEIYALGKVGFTGRREANIVRVPTLMSSDARRPDHPTPKPIPLMEMLAAKTVGTIADPFAGSGATLIAARHLGRPIIAVEIDESYCELIVKRLSQQAFDFGEIA